MGKKKTGPRCFRGKGYQVTFCGKSTNDAPWTRIELRVTCPYCISRLTPPDRPGWKPGDKR